MKKLIKNSKFVYAIVILHLLFLISIDASGKHFLFIISKCFLLKLYIIYQPFSLTFFYSYFESQIQNVLPSSIVCSLASYFVEHQYA